MSAGQFGGGLVSSVPAAPTGVTVTAVLKNPEPPRSEIPVKNSDFIKSLFYPVLLTAILVYFSMLGLHALHHGPTDTPFLTAMLDNTKLVLGALLGLVTGYQMGKGSNDTPAK